MAAAGPAGPLRSRGHLTGHAGARPAAGIRVGRDDIEFAEADIERMPFGDGEFDLWCASTGCTACRIRRPRSGEIARCLMPGGRLVGDAVVRGAGSRQDLVIAALRRAGLFGPGGSADDLQPGSPRPGCRVDRLQRSGALSTSPRHATPKCGYLRRRPRQHRHDDAEHHQHATSGQRQVQPLMQAAFAWSTITSAI